MGNRVTENTYKDFLDSLIKGDHAMCSERAKDLFDNTSMFFLYESILKKALYDIGELWERNKISVATEHLASAIVESILNEYFSKISLKEKNNKKVIVACLENEYHQIGIKMVSHIFEMNGWKSHYIGANTPSYELLSYTRTIKPDLLAVSISIYFNIPVLEEMIQLIRTEFPSLPIMVGGQAFCHGGLDVLTKYENVFYKSDLQNIESFIKN